jgi:anion-transporting  ArsA/GET3 family ATPase
MPEIGLEWAHTFMALWLKYRAVVGLGELGWDLVSLSRDLKDLRALLTDGARTRVVAVTRLGHLPLAETARLVAGVRARGLHLSGVIVNAVAGGGCAHASPRGGAGADARASLAAAGVRPGTVVEAPLASPPPIGPAALSRWARGWRLVP